MVLSYTETKGTGKLSGLAFIYLNEHRAKSFAVDSIRVDDTENNLFKYFAYGSNMSSRRLKARVSVAKIVGVAVLKSHTLVFHKVSVDGSAKCDIAESEAEEVFGVLFELSRSEKAKLDRLEGLHHGYDEKEVEVQLGPGLKETATTYFATNVDSGIRPFTWYKRHVLEGAKEAKLPLGYIEAIETVEADQDPDSIREARELAIYS